MDCRAQIWTCKAPKVAQSEPEVSQEAVVAVGRAGCVQGPQALGRACYSMLIMPPSSARQIARAVCGQ